jgi:hypothetical protein
MTLRRADVATPIEIVRNNLKRMRTEPRDSVYVSDDSYVRKKEITMKGCCASWANIPKMLFVMAGLDPASTLSCQIQQGRGWPAQGRA